MKLEQQVCSLELAKKLKELGVKQESLWYWFNAHLILGHGNEHETDMPTCWCKPEVEVQPKGGLVVLHKKETPLLSAFTVAELGEMLPDNFHTFRKGGNGKYWCGLDRKLQKITGELWWNHEEADTEADARAKMLVYLLENKLIETPPAQIS